MQSKREQVLVGLFVLIAVAVLFGTVFAMSGAYGQSTTKFSCVFPFAGGLNPARPCATRVDRKSAALTASGLIRRIPHC